ncbi:major capsid protein [Xanthomonas phage HXX_Dennis]|nr:major capsid protein [Stenotrophomonas phage Suso]UTQ79896.1 major capsid protein [Xanthomonas phage HXX_Dennis]
MQRPYPNDVRLTGLTIAYRNPDFIADRVMPRVEVPTSSFKWDEWDFAEGLALPVTKVGRKGRPTEVEFSSVQRDGSVEDHGLDDVIPLDDINDIPPGSTLDPLGRATEGLTDLIALGREIRVAGLSRDPANYNHHEVVAAGDRWTDPNSDPSVQILDAISTPLVRPNVAVTSLGVLNILRKNVAIVSAITGNTSGRGIVSAQQLAAYFELEAIEIGQAYANTAKPGQTPVYSRVWGNDFSLIRRGRNLGLRGVTEPSWGMTAEWGTRVAKQIPEPKTGLRGAVRVRVGESVGEVIQSKEAGYLLQGVIG